MWRGGRREINNEEESEEEPPAPEEAAGSRLKGHGAAGNAEEAESDGRRDGGAPAHQDHGTAKPQPNSNNKARKKKKKRKNKRTPVSETLVHWHQVLRG
ncbi:hypothetical protein Y1Q_0013902 [Alligator mississippiensis]|uniref:Uncharacterized protein n=1 Tax=Alligator mississippiensis TaxID=8496 RepID=A0A151MR84_ALLMI|nr:hypothetical protein Y1Q_0013902 [Alligator mississippiensis]